MSIKTGRYGLVSWDGPPIGSPIGSPDLEPLISIKGFKLSLKTDYEDVTCFQDTNKVYVPGLRDISGSFEGFWNSDNLELVKASQDTTPGWLRLQPNNSDDEAAFIFEGLAYMDMDLDCTVNGAPKISSTFRAGGPWTVPTGSV